ncbi:methionine--tRNA ligase [Candidatus Magnetomonas plexicatena]|uniref:methionine--tRNA ligase n=1 Tax=Candidatus Magnetomonas plexicatena TaxID=2552947 RepID=UPI001C760EB7|nr:methionine--tRNA ligase [Nitrospirales bacterium LBB_01]
MPDRFYITTPIYYVNDIPHIGHAYTTVAADIAARFHRMRGADVFFLTGTDEHGQKVLQAAELRCVSPKDHTDTMCTNFKKLWAALDITNNAFIRTTDKEHIDTVREMLQKLYDSGEIVKRTYEGSYCTHDERFWTDKEVIDGNCPECSRPVETIKEDNYFFLMSKYQDRLIEHINKNSGFIRPETRKNEVLGFLKSNPLGDLCISRPKKRLSWGIPLPFDDNYVTYVWFDALLNYYSATCYLTKECNQTYWWPADCHIVGKDIVTTHAVYWPSMLMALKLPLPEMIFAHGWWTIDGKKMSKSVGNVVDPHKVTETYGVDAFRYFLMREVTFGLDGDYSEAALIKRFDTDLANDLGNLVNRSFAMLSKYFDGKVPEPPDIDIELKELAEGISERLKEHLKVLSFSKALDAVWELVSFLNKYIDSNKPWVLAKDSSSAQRLAVVMYSLVEGIRFISVYLYPFMPKFGERLYSHITCEPLSTERNINAKLKWGTLKSGSVVTTIEQLFPKMERKDKVDEKDTTTEVPEKTDELISIEDFAKVKLKVGKILSAEPVPKSNKLIKLSVDTGSEIRQVVAGIGKHYKADELIGKTVIVVANLKPAKLMGVESHGMVLAASEGDVLKLVTPDGDLPAGSVVK